MNGPRSFDFKLIIVGESHVGKTTMLNKYVGGTGIENNDFVRHTMKRDGRGIILQIHDTKGNFSVLITCRKHTYVYCFKY